jgi:ABC-type glycerol-3-phosphate transport system substrate-binding protein
MPRGFIRGPLRPTISRRHLLCFIVGTSAIGLLAACGGSGATTATVPIPPTATTQPTPVPPAPTATPQAVKVTLMTAQSQGAVDRDQKVADMLRAKHPEIEVTFEMPKADRHVEFPIRLAAGDPPDMVYLNNGSWRQYARKAPCSSLIPTSGGTSPSAPTSHRL